MGSRFKWGVLIAVSIFFCFAGSLNAGKKAAPSDKLSSGVETKKSTTASKSFQKKKTFKKPAVYDLTIKGLSVNKRHNQLYVSFKVINSGKNRLPLNAYRQITIAVKVGPLKKEYKLEKLAGKDMLKPGSSKNLQVVLKPKSNELNQLAAVRGSSKATVKVSADHLKEIHKTNNLAKTNCILRYDLLVKKSKKTHGALKAEKHKANISPTGLKPAAGLFKMTSSKKTPPKIGPAANAKSPRLLGADKIRLLKATQRFFFAGNNKGDTNRITATKPFPDQGPAYRNVPELNQEANRIPGQNDIAHLRQVRKEKALEAYYHQGLNDPRDGRDRSRNRRRPPDRPEFGVPNSWQEQVKQATYDLELIDYCNSVDVELDYECSDTWPIEDGNDYNESSDDDWVIEYEDGTIDDGSDNTQTDVEEDPEPEGDDPDELRSPVLEQALALRAETSSSRGSGAGTSDDSGQQGSMPQGTGSPNQNHNRLSPPKDPEGGGPDNVKGGAINPAVASAGEAGSISPAAHSSVASSPAVGNPGDPPPPPRPEFAKAESRRTLFNSQETSSSSSVTASPAVGDPGDPPSPPRPENGE
jgi:hypothetical protein